jgi:excisionase family DNA binding protein
MEKLLLTIEELCGLTHLGRSTVYGLLDKPNGFRTVRIGLRAVRIPMESVKEWITNNQTPAGGVEPNE